MKYRFSVLAPHPDDEFIGARSLIKRYKNYIDVVVFITNGERSLISFPDMESYIKTRRGESILWLKENAPKADIHWINIPDQLDINSSNTMYESSIFEEVNNSPILTFLYNKINNIVGDNIIVMPTNEKHPSHSTTFTIGELLKNKKIYYSVHKIMKKTVNLEAGVYYHKVNTLGKTFYSYHVIYSKKELDKKEKEFEKFYHSQYINFKKTGLKFRNYEHYVSETPLSLCGENNFNVLSGVVGE